MLPLVSIVILVYNVDHYIDGVWAQTYTNYNVFFCVRAVSLRVRKLLNRTTDNSPIRYL